MQKFWKLQKEPVAVLFNFFTPKISGLSLKKLSRAKKKITGTTANTVNQVRDKKHESLEI